MDRKLRSVLYVPAINEKAMRKAATLSVDAVIFDLEDSVSPEQKALARVGLAEFLAKERASFQGKYLVIRINADDTEYWCRKSRHRSTSMTRMRRSRQAPHGRPEYGA